MSPSKGQAPEKGAAVSHHSQEDRGEVRGGCQQPSLQLCSPVWDNIITHTQHMLFCAWGQDLRLILLMLSLQSLVKPVMNK